MADKAHSAGNPACKSSVPIIKRHDSNRDAAILNAFARWKALHAERDALILKMPANAEAPLWREIDQAESEVHDLPTTTAKGIACKLWIAIPANTADAEPEAAAFRTDLDWFVGEAEMLDWNLRCIVAALVALKSMEG